MSLCLLSCAGATPVRETTSRPRVASSARPPEWEVPRARKKAQTATSKSEAATSKSEVEATRDAKTSPSELEDELPSKSFAGTDTAAPKDDDRGQVHEVEVKGIEGTTSEYDVRSTLESREGDFDICHDRVGGGSGRIEFRIHITENGDVGGVKVRRMKVRNSKLVDCYTEVVSSSHFTRPHGGYADVKWTTKVGRSRKRPDALFERRVRWDAPASSGGTRRAEAEGRRERRQRARPDGA
jgi:hypothetical protein